MICSRCKIDKPDVSFSVDSKRARGRSRYCAQCFSEYRKAWISKPENAASLAKMRQSRREWGRENRCKLRTERALRSRRDYATPYKRLNNLTMSNIRYALSGRKNMGKLVPRLPYTADELRKSIESKFKDGMGWDNWEEWHIDHIVPLASFDFENDPDAFIKAFDLNNLQPLYARENLLKGAKLIAA